MRIQTWVCLRGVNVTPGRLGGGDARRDRSATVCGNTRVATISCMSRDFVKRHFLLDTPQLLMADVGNDSSGLEQPVHARIVHDAAGGEDGARVGKSLHPRRDVDGLAEVVLAF